MTEEAVEVKPWTHFYWDIFANTCWPFDEALVVCGRTEGQFQYEDEELSSKHCQFSIEDGKCFITDLESKNCTYLNLKELTPSKPVELQCFDVVIFGKQIIVYLNPSIFKVKTRDNLLEVIDININNEDIFNVIKNKAIVFMKSHHPRLIIRKKIQLLEAKIASAYNQKEEKLSKYDDKAKEVQGVIDQHQNKISQLKAQVSKLMTDKEALGAKIDPQIDALHAQMEKFNDEYESIADQTTI